MANNNSPILNKIEKGKKLQKLPFLIKHYKQTIFIGFIFVILAFCMMILTLIFTEISLIFFIFLISFFLFLGSLMLNAGFVGHEFLKILENILPENIKFDMIRLTMNFRYNEMIYSIRYHALYSPYTMWIYLLNYFPKYEGPVEHYQIWTKISDKNFFFENQYELAKKMRAQKISGALFPIQPTPPKNPFSNEIKYTFSKGERVPTLCYFDFAERNEKSILIAFLRKDASPGDIKKIIKIMQSEIDNITF